MFEIIDTGTGYGKMMAVEPAVIVDVSKWQGNINKDKMIQNAKGIIIRAGNIGSGGPWTDTQFHNNAEKFNGEIPCGYYWYFHPEYSASIQANHYIQLLKNVQVDIFAAADVEGNVQKVSRNTFDNRLKEFIERVEDALSKRGAIYTRASFWNDQLGNPPWAASRIPWIARYSNSLTGPWSDGRFKPSSWNDWWLWQYSAGGNGRGAEFGAQSSDIDINRFNGSLSKFYQEIGWNQGNGNGDDDPPPEEEGWEYNISTAHFDLHIKSKSKPDDEEPDTILVEMTEDCAFFRYDPQIDAMSNAHVGRTERPDQWIVKNTVFHKSGMKWYQIVCSQSGNPEFRDYYIRKDKSKIV